jgi:tRNA pseudouridine65 synthase
MLEVIYRDEHLVAINKPSGLLVHRSPIDRHETRFAVQLLRDQIGQRVYPVHRLDKPTSGLLLFALSPELVPALSLQFEQRRVVKRYVAVTRGWCPEAGEIDHPLRDKPDLPGDSGRQGGPSRDALTRYRRLATVQWPEAVDRYPAARYSLVALLPSTGRRHQLRRHMKHIGHPIIGDAKHGKGIHNRFFARRWQCRRLLLACTGLGLEHPLSSAPLRLRCGLDPAFDRVAAAFGWEPALRRSIEEALP